MLESKFCQNFWFAKAAHRRKEDIVRAVENDFVRSRSGIVVATAENFQKDVAVTGHRAVLVADIMVR